MVSGGERECGVEVGSGLGTRLPEARSVYHSQLGQDDTAVSYKCPCQSQGQEALLPVEAPGPRHCSSGASQPRARPSQGPSPQTSGLSWLLSLRCKAKEPNTASPPPPTHPPSPLPAPSATARALRAGANPGTTPGLGTQPASLVAASRATVPTQQSAPHRPPRLPTGHIQHGEQEGGGDRAPAYSTGAGTPAHLGAPPGDLP